MALPRLLGGSMTAHGQCTATKTSTGEPCQAIPLHGQPTCLMHSEAGAEARRRGGRKKAQPPDALDVTQLPLRTHEDCRRAAEVVSQAVLSGTVTPRVGSVAAGLIRAAQTSIDDVMAQKVAALTERLKAAQPQGTGRRR